MNGRSAESRWFPVSGLLVGILLLRTLATPPYKVDIALRVKSI